MDITVSVDSSGPGIRVSTWTSSASKSAHPAARPGRSIVVLDVLPPDYVRQFVSRSEGGTVMLPDGTVKIVVEPLAPPKNVDIELMKVNLQAHGVPAGEDERVVVAIESSTYPPGGDIPEDVAYSPALELWMMLPDGEETACDAGRARLYSVQDGWSLLEHRCETDESGNEWAVSGVERLGAFALVIDDSPVTPTPTTAAAAMATPAASVMKSASSVSGAHVAACSPSDTRADCGANGRCPCRLHRRPSLPRQRRLRRLRLRRLRPRFRRLSSRPLPWCRRPP